MSTNLPKKGSPEAIELSSEHELPQIAALQRVLRTHTQKLLLPDFEMLPEELMSVAEELETLTGHWNPVAIYGPPGEEAKREREKFLEARKRGERIEPRFTYPVAERMDVDGARASLERLDRVVLAYEPENETARLGRVALHFKIKDDLATCDLVDGLKTKNEPLIKRALEAKYPGTDPAIIERAEAAYKELCSPPPKKEPTEEEKKYRLEPWELEELKNIKYSPEEQKERFEWALQRSGILRSPECPDGFNVVISPDVSSIDVRDKCEDGPTIFVPANRDLEEVNGLEMGYLLAHEIGHARQAMNGTRIFRLGGKALRLDDESLYEGHGMRQENDFLTRYTGEREDLETAMYVLAIKAAEDGKSFSEIVDEQEPRWLHVYGKIPADEPIPDTLDAAIREQALKKAYRTAYRVMRGHTDMSNTAAYAMPKDLGYFRGIQLDEKLQAMGLGVLNEAVIMSTNALPLLARFDVKEEDIPYPNDDAADVYMEEMRRNLREKRREKKS